MKSLNFSRKVGSSGSGSGSVAGLFTINWYRKNEIYDTTDVDKENFYFLVDLRSTSESYEKKIENSSLISWFSFYHWNWNFSTYLSCIAFKIPGSGCIY